EWYTQQVSGKLMGPDFQKMKDERPDEVVFNGVAFQYKDHPLPATPGGLVRIYFVNAGPDLWSSFHVIGGIFDKVYPGGNPAEAVSGVSTYSVGPGAGAIFDITLDQPGNYVFVDHDMAHAIIGAQGVLQVGDAAAIAAEKPPITAAAAPAAPAAAPAGTAPKTAAPAGPYRFDPAHGASLYASTCAACHQATGMGLPGAFPPLKDDPVVMNPDPTEQIDTILHGAHGRNIGGTTYPSAMPPFGSVLSDADVADIANHERSSWGNQAKPVTADQVQAVRAKGPGKP
ncbi:MAG: c-type cytochrome, partial [Rhodanobacteraceae bacterium]